MNKWNMRDIELAIELIKNGLNYSDIAKQLNRSIKSVKLKLNKLGYKTSEFKIEEPIKYCECCNSIIENAGIKYCSSSCAAKINNILYPKRTKLDNYKTKKQNFCLYCGGLCVKKYCSYSCHQEKRKEEYKEKILSNDPLISNRLYRKFLIEEYGAKCMECGWDKVNPITKNCPIELEHIDGNSRNNELNNLKLLCPNCHSLTPTYKALNIGKGRHSRMKRYKEGKSY
jgi:hypothetical protein